MDVRRFLKRLRPIHPCTRRVAKVHAVQLVGKSRMVPIGNEEIQSSCHIHRKYRERSYNALHYILTYCTSATSSMVGLQILGSARNKKR